MIANTRPCSHRLCIMICRSAEVRRTLPIPVGSRHSQVETNRKASRVGGGAGTELSLLLRHLDRRHSSTKQPTVWRTAALFLLSHTLSPRLHNLPFTPPASSPAFAMSTRPVLLASPNPACFLFWQQPRSACTCCFPSYTCFLFCYTISSPSTEKTQSPPRFYNYKLIHSYSHLAIYCRNVHDVCVWVESQSIARVTENGSSTVMTEFERRPRN
jgi:hypothetical protein